MLQNNVYRLGLLTHLQNEHVPLKVPECLRDLRTMYEAATIDDVNDAYAQFQMDDDHVFTCVGTSGEKLSASPARCRNSHGGEMSTCVITKQPYHLGSIAQAQSPHSTLYFSLAGHAC